MDNIGDVSEQQLVVHTSNPSNWEAEAGGSLQPWTQPGVHWEFQANYAYKVRPYLDNQSNKSNQTSKQTKSYFSSSMHLKEKNN